MLVDTSRGDETTYVLYVGSRIGGESESNAQILTVMREVGRMARTERVEPGSNDLSVDLVFDVPGPFFAFDSYQGARTGRLSRERRLLQVQVAVPSKLDIEAAWNFFEGALLQTSELAKRYTEDHRLDYSLDPLSDVIDRVVRRIHLRK